MNWTTERSPRRRTGRCRKKTRAVTMASNIGFNPGRAARGLCAMTTSGERAITATCWDASWHIASRRGRCRGSEEKAMTKQRKVRVHVESLEASGRGFVDAWRRAKRGEPIHKEHLSFESLEGLLATLSPKRIELVRFVRRRPKLSTALIRAVL